MFIILMFSCILAVATVVARLLLPLVFFSKFGTNLTIFFLISLMINSGNDNKLTLCSQNTSDITSDCNRFYSK